MTVHLDLLADSIRDAVRPHCPDPSPVRDASETDLVDTLHAAGSADRYMVLRLTDVRRRVLHNPTPSTVDDALVALGSYQHLLDLQTAGVPA